MKSCLSSRLARCAPLLLVGLLTQTEPGGAQTASSAASADSDPVDLIELDGALLFFADDGVHGTELWRSDGTSGGTGMVYDLLPGPDRSQPSGWGRLGDELVFCSCRNFSMDHTSDPCSDHFGLWKTDGTPRGTERLAAIDLECNRKSSFATLGNRVFFAGENRNAGSELWATDGTKEGTVLVRDLWPGEESSRPIDLFPHRGLVFFGASDETGEKLWRSDGSAEGTFAIAELGPGYNDYLWVFTEYQGRLYFSADDGRRGGELWTSDGTSEGTRLVREIRSGKEGSEIEDMIDFGGYLYFSASDRQERELWRSDGSRKGTRRFDLNPSGSSHPDHFVRLGSQFLLFGADDTHGYELWSVGAGDFTGLVKDILPGKKGSMPSGFEVLGEIAVFGAKEERHGLELWRTDGTEQGTRLVRDIFPGPSSSTPREETRVGDLVFFAASDGRHGRELWVTDGTARGTRLVADIHRTD